MILFAKLQQRCQDYWRRLSPDRRRQLTGASLLVVLLVGYLIIAPWINWQRKLDKALPQLRTDLAHMQQLAEQVRKLPVATTNADPVATTNADPAATAVSRETPTNTVRPELVEGQFSQNQGLRQAQPERGGVNQRLPSAAGQDGNALWAALLADLQQEFTASHSSIGAPLIREVGPQRVQLSLSQTDFDATVATIARLQKKYGLSVISAKFTQADGTGTGTGTGTAVQAEIIVECLAGP